MPAKKGMEIVYLPIGDLNEYENNAKIHDRDNIEAIKKSIQTFGNCDPIGVWTNPEGRHIIVEGFGRKIALKELGHDEAPCILLNHLTDDERRAYTIAHNQTTLMSGFDQGILMDEIDSIEWMDWGTFGIMEPMDLDFAVDGFGGEDEEKGEPELFSMTFVFPSDKRGIIESYVKRVGKDTVAQSIVDKAVDADA